MMLSNKKESIAIDGMGGDGAPAAILGGLSKCYVSDFHYIIFGNGDVLERYTFLLPKNMSYEIRHTDVVVTGDMDVLSSLRSGKDSSMGLAIRAVQSGEARAVVSSGNTGLYMALAKVLLKTIESIDRPAIASVIPGLNGKMIFLDLGANTVCTVKNLLDFAIMGEALARSVFNKKDIKLALLNIGTEESKGSGLVKKTSEILKKFFSNYVGFVEGDDLSKGNVDVVVTDGFTGNVALKTMEGTAKYLIAELKNSLSSSFFSRARALFALPSINSFRKKLDPRRYNGAILLGLNGVVVKSHGNSDDVGFANAVGFTMNILQNNIFDRIREQLEKSKICCAYEYSEEK
ncbi:MAG: phosphate acyltransferase PlsX [Holosporaceae bacterium]|jgi:glycerol-3-phosphate acyltransferase PlsX|nr:phosphate acyltransferase PlsX [Holosporaceae bacterium]